MKRKGETTVRCIFQLVLIFTSGVFFLSCGSSTIDVGELPQHTVQEISLGAKGMRIQIDVSENFLPPQDCENLINYYKSRAKPNGQVSIHGPSPKMQKLFPNDPEGKKPQPWAYDNLDGTGIHYNENFYGEV